MGDEADDLIDFFDEESSSGYFFSNIKKTIIDYTEHNNLLLNSKTKIYKEFSKGLIEWNNSCMDVFNASLLNMQKQLHFLKIKKIIKSTDKAIYVQIGKLVFWLPKSKIILGSINGVNYIAVPHWLFNKKGDEYNSGKIKHA